VYDPAIPERCGGKKFGALRIQRKDATHESLPTGIVSKLDFVEKTVGEAAKIA
jgi:hypothetical protein